MNDKQVLMAIKVSGIFVAQMMNRLRGGSMSEKIYQIRNHGE